MAELRAELTFDPAKINLQQAQHQCEHGGRRSACVKVKVCFDYRVKSEKWDATATTGEPLGTVRGFVRASGPSPARVRPAEMRYELTLDAPRAKARASFIQGDRKIGRELSIETRRRSCQQDTFMMEVSSA